MSQINSVSQNFIYPIHRELSPTIFQGFRIIENEKIERDRCRTGLNRAGWERIDISLHTLSAGEGEWSLAGN